MHECKLPLNKCISPKILLSLTQNSPWNLELGTFFPLLVMQESRLQIQACAPQIYNEHYNMLKIET
jgi:hypothetical protein